ncbi:hypothetical protein AVEN_98642-1 [Araneus ventricosus]|uniref:Uncharacterized protein n=1 Tax=Araneus ventricosus TaxID=182803 RepID=A0A4Y1ZQR5_ARAVE|nr:hypothetical protein AVEN_98642-1 [Araneus ventricosus]
MILFEQMHYLIQKGKERFGNLKQAFRHNAVHYFDLYVISKDCSGHVVRKMADAIANLPSEVSSVKTEQIGKLFAELLKRVFIRKCPSKYGEVNYIIWKIVVFLLFELGCAKWIEEFSNIINQNTNRKARLPKSNHNLTENLLTSKLSQLKEAFIDFDLKDGTSSVDFSSFESNKELQAVTEMLVLDILCILKSSCCRNPFFLDSDYPLLTGKNLRNHLAHGNDLIDVCLEESSAQLLINAKKCLTAVLPKNDKKMDRVIKCDYIKLESSIYYDLQIISNQRKLFVALGEGNVKDIEESVNGGADVYGKDYISSTCLHFAVKATDIAALKWILKQGLSINSENIAGETLLHIAAKFNRTEVMRYLVEQEHMSLVVSCHSFKFYLKVIYLPK